MATGHPAEGMHQGRHVLTRLEGADKDEKWRSVTESAGPAARTGSSGPPDSRAADFQFGQQGGVQIGSGFDRTEAIEIDPMVGHHQIAIHPAPTAQTFVPGY